MLNKYPIIRVKGGSEREHLPLPLSLSSSSSDVVLGGGESTLALFLVLAGSAFFAFGLASGVAFYLGTGFALAAGTGFLAGAAAYLVVAALGAGLVPPFCIV